MKQLQTLAMSGLLLLAAQLVSHPALAEESRYTGTIESVSQEGEQITVSGREYRISYKALIILDGYRISIDALEPGQQIRYSLKDVAGEQYMKVVELLLPADAKRPMLEH